MQKTMGRLICSEDGADTEDAIIMPASKNYYIRSPEVMIVTQFKRVRDGTLHTLPNVTFLFILRVQ
jgi:hypothetical protein